MVRVISPEGNQLGVMAISEALKLAQLQNYDLVEVAPNARPPVCRIMDFGKYKYERNKHDRQARKKTHTYTIKEVKVRPKIEEHDFTFKMRNARKFLTGRDKVKFTCMFRGREMAHQELGAALLDRIVEELDDVAFVESRPKMEGRAMIMIMAPRKDQKPSDDGGSDRKADAAEGAEPQRQQRER
ncbi:MAG: translation initiation factor IF-3 [Candidatus Eisenbacteria bacterium]|nr:translation initiation factor IF-3 [Candidatus Latescibacterota bacterium]MBD3302984.1 translation initiation factor IF-3 [Candidatus Eisenbacteria bacterium]